MSQQPRPVVVRQNRSPMALALLVISLVVVAGIAAVMLVVLPQQACAGNPACQTGGTGGNTCLGPLCIPGTSGGAITIYNTRSWSGQVTVNAVMLPGTPTALGEVKTSCSWFTCAVTGVTVNTVVVVNDQTAGTSFRASSWQFKLGLNDAETYVVSLPSLTNGHAYQVQITETVQTFTNGLRTGTLTNTVTWPISGQIAIGAWSS